MTQIGFEVHESPEGGYEASALGHRIHTQGDTWEELKTMVQNAVRCHFDDADRPTVVRVLLTREELLSA